MTNNTELLKAAIKQVHLKYEFNIIALCILKNHIHMIIKEPDLNNYSKIVGNIKKYFSYYYTQKPPKNILPDSMKKRKEAGVWQRRFYDHIIRNEEDLYKHIDYIHYNPYKHYNIAPKDWPFSTFHKFVKNDYYDENWLNAGDKNKIIDMDLE